MKLVDEYISALEEPKKEWVTLMVNFMREVFPEVEETLDNEMPTYKGDSFSIAFAAQKNYFSFYTNDARILPLIKELVPPASMGKGCARIKSMFQSPRCYNSIKGECVFESKGTYIKGVYGNIRGSYFFAKSN